MSTLAIAVNVALTLMALSVFGLGVAIASRLTAPPGYGGRADWRGPGRP